MQSEELNSQHKVDAEDPDIKLAYNPLANTQRKCVDEQVNIVPTVLDSQGTCLSRAKNSAHKLCCLTKKRKIVSTTLIISSIVALAALVISLVVLLSTRLNPKNEYQIKGFDDQLYIVKEFEFKPSGEFKTYNLKYTAPYIQTLRILQSSTNKEQDVLGVGCITLDQSVDSGYMVKQCGDKDPEIMILGDNIDELYEKELSSTGYNATDGKRMLQENDMEILMSELAEEIKIDGYSSKIEDLITFNKDGQVIPNYDANNNGRILAGR